MRTAASNKIAGKRRAKGPGTVLSVERLFRPDGSRESVVVLDSNSPTFTRDLTLLFEKNVARVRRAHKRKFGSADRVGRKV
jgi:hypothetical protein